MQPGDRSRGRNRGAGFETCAKSVQHGIASWTGKRALDLGRIAMGSSGDNRAGRPADSLPIPLCEARTPTPSLVGFALFPFANGPALLEAFRHGPVEAPLPSPRNSPKSLLATTLGRIVPMGKPEKLVVLTLLFGAALVLALALTRSGGEVGAKDPLSGAQRVLGETSAGSDESSVLDAQSPPQTDEILPAAADAPASSVPVSGAKSTTGAAQGLLLNAGADSEREAALDSRFSSEPATSTLALDPVSDPTKRILVEAAGLRPSFLEDYMMYTVAEGDTWSALAQRFYRDGGFTRNLHLANEHLDELATG